MNTPESNSEQPSGSNRRAFLKASSFASVLGGAPAIFGGLIASAGSANAATTSSPATTTGGGGFTHTYMVDGSHDGIGTLYPAVVGLTTSHNSLVLYASLFAYSSPAMLPSLVSGTVYFKLKAGASGPAPADVFEVWGQPFSVTGWLDASAGWNSGVDDDNTSGTTNPTSLAGKDSHRDLFSFGGTWGQPALLQVKGALEVLSDTPGAARRDIKVKVGIKEDTTWYPGAVEFDIWVKRLPESVGTGGGGGGDE